mgnify:CR=1 FL=1
MSEIIRPLHPATPVGIVQLKRDARRLAKKTGKLHMHCLEVLAIRAGFSSFAAMRAATFGLKTETTS